jgi:hypothetical protein
MMHCLFKLSIMMALLLMNTFAVVTAFMRGTRPTEVLDGSLKTRSLAAIVAATRQRHLLTDVDKVQGLVHDAKLLAARGSSGLIPSSAGGMTGFDGNEQETDDCVDIDVYAWRNDVTNPQAFTDDTGAVHYYFDLIGGHPETAIGSYIDMPSITQDINGYCEKAGAWYFFDEDLEDTIGTWARCDGKLYTLDDGTLARQLIVPAYSTGKYECATGTVGQGRPGKDQSRHPDLVPFKIEYCIDPSTCV